ERAARFFEARCDSARMEAVSQTVERTNGAEKSAPVREIPSALRGYRLRVGDGDVHLQVNRRLQRIGHEAVLLGLVQRPTRLVRVHACGDAQRDLERPLGKLQGAVDAIQRPDGFAVQ